MNFYADFLYEMLPIIMLLYAIEYTDKVYRKKGQVMMLIVG
jgi:hypothetical protein